MQGYLHGKHDPDLRAGSGYGTDRKTERIALVYGGHVVIPVTRREFREGFKTHYNCYKGIRGYDKSRRLLLFYSVECGLKCLLLKRIQKNTYSELLAYDGMDILKNDGHNLKELLKKLDAEDKFRLKAIRIKKREQISPAEFNQLWRYGVETLDNKEEERAEETLRDIAGWLDEQL